MPEGIQSLSGIIGARNPQEGRERARRYFPSRLEALQRVLAEPAADLGELSRQVDQQIATGEVPAEVDYGKILNPIIDAKNPIPVGLGTFGGQLAKKAPKGFDEALIGSITGKLKQGARSKTGWRMGPDNQMRFEIDDKTAKLYNIEELQLQRGIYKTEIPLERILQHDELFKQYPELKKVKVYKTNQEGLRGSFMAHWNKKGALDGGTIKLNPKDRTESQMMGTMLHEVQHWIQTIENFSPGSSTKQFEQLLSNKTRVQKHAIRTSNTSKIAKLMSSESISRTAAAKELKMKYGKYNISDLDEYAKSGDMQQLLINERVAKQEWDVLKGLSKDSTGWNYVRTLGEMEARDVSARYYMRQHAPQSDLERIPPVINRARTEVIDEGPYSGEIINPQTEALMLPADKPGGYIEIGGIKNVTGR